MNRKIALISMLFPLMLACGAGNNSAAKKSSAGIDEEKLSAHLRESYDIPAFVKIELTEPKKSEIPGLTSYTVLFHAGPGVQRQALQVSDDGRFYFLGAFKDLNFDPVADRLSKMNLANAAMRGSKDAPISVVEFTDFECPFCQRGYKMMAEGIMKEYEGKVRWYFKSLPLVQIHPWAKSAHMAAECARLQGGDQFWSLHDKIFDAQRAITVANAAEKIEEFAEASGVKMGPFRKCVDGKNTLAVVDADMAEADSLGFQSAPLFVVNGRLVKGADYDGLKSLVEEELAKIEGQKKGD